MLEDKGHALWAEDDMNTFHMSQRCHDLRDGFSHDAMGFGEKLSAMPKPKGITFTHPYCASFITDHPCCDDVVTCCNEVAACFESADTVRTLSECFSELSPACEP
jgi:hypothetical protein